VQGDFLSSKPNSNSNGPAAGVASPPPRVPSEPVVHVAEAAVAPSPIITAAPRIHRGPLLLTIAGVIIFIGGVTGLFVYALSGQ
jgi:hypothetical protein